MPRKRHTTRIQAQPAGQLQPQHRQCDRYAAPGFEHSIEVAVVRVVVVVDVAAKAQITKKELIERAQLLQRRRIQRQPALDACQQLIHIAQHLLHVQFGVIVLSQTDGGFQQRKVLITLNQTGEILQRRRCIQI